MWCTEDLVVCVVVAHSPPRDARLVGPLPLGPVMDGTPGEEVVASGEGYLRGRGWGKGWGRGEGE